MAVHGSLSLTLVGDSLQLWAEGSFGLQSSKLAALERAWRERDRGDDAVTGAAASLTVVGAAGLIRRGGASAGTALPGGARARPGDHLATIPEEVANEQALRGDGDRRVEPGTPAVIGSQQLSEPGKQALKRRRVLKRPPLGGSISEGF